MAIWFFSSTHTRYVLLSGCRTSYDVDIPRFACAYMMLPPRLGGFTDGSAASKSVHFMRVRHELFMKAHDIDADFNPCYVARHAVAMPRLHFAAAKRKQQRCCYAARFMPALSAAKAYARMPTIAQPSRQPYAQHTCIVRGVNAGGGGGVGTPWGHLVLNAARYSGATRYPVELSKPSITTNRGYNHCQS